MTETYNEINKHGRDCRIVFEPESHSYIVDGDIVCDSVTTVVADCFPKFDIKYWSARKATPECPAEMIKAQWEEKGRIARDEGTLMHARIERHYMGLEPDAEALADPSFRQFMSFAEANVLTPYRTEWPIFMKEYRIAGTLDFLAFDGEKFRIFDWKRSTKVVDSTGRPLTDSFGRHAFAPVETIPDTTFHHYALQLSLYRYILAAAYGISVDSCHLGVFHPDMNDYHTVEVPYLLPEVESLLASRR